MTDYLSTVSEAREVRTCACVAIDGEREGSMDKVKGEYVCGQGKARRGRTGQDRVGHSRIGGRYFQIFICTGTK